MKIKNENKIANIITENHIIIDYAVKYAKVQEQIKEQIIETNYIRLYKHAYLLYELVGILSRK